VTLLEIIARMRNQLAAGAQSCELDVLDPDHARGHYAGERVEVAGTSYVHRPLRVWLDLAERLNLRLRTPRAIEPPLLRLTFEPLDETERMRPQSTPEPNGDPTERYGIASPFSRISKLDDPGFVLDVEEALGRIALRPGARVLDLGVNTGDELELLLALDPVIRDVSLFGIDHSRSAIEAASARFSHRSNVTLHEANIADPAAITRLDLGRFDLVISIGTFQSAGIDDRELLRRVVQDYLVPEGSIIIGMPNCRYVDGEIEYGARMKNFSQPELGLLFKDVAFFRKYLQQHHRKVYVTGKHEVLITAVAQPRE
jgi:SAM-dependent methyltransferase